jgi:hypothetical protein
MPMVYIECPGTGNLVQTRHILPDDQKLQEAINRNIPVECPYCNNTHIWNDENGFFLGSVPKKPNSNQPA